MDDEAVLVDTNVLLTATTPARALHTEALEVLNEWPAQGFALCVSGQVFREYLVVATRPDLRRTNAARGYGSQAVVSPDSKPSAKISSHAGGRSKASVPSATLWALP